MSKLHVFVVSAISVTLTVLVLGWKYDLEYWQRIRAGAFGPSSLREAKEGTLPLLSVDGAAPREPRSDKPTDKEAAETWINWVKATRARDPNWMPPVYTHLGDLKSVQNCVIEFTVVQIDDANARIISHQGERIWLIGSMAGMSDNKSYKCKGLFAPIGTYQSKTVADGTRTLAAYRYSGEAPDVFALKN